MDQKTHRVNHLKSTVIPSAARNLASAVESQIPRRRLGMTIFVLMYDVHESGILLYVPTIKMTLPRSPMRQAILTLAIFSLLAGGVHAANPGVEVNQSSIQLQRRTFNPKHPPADMPPLQPGEAAFTEFNYGCTAEASYTRTQGVGVDRVTIQNVQMNITLSITIWLPEKSTPRLHDHEEGHKEIGQIIYKNTAEQAARQAAQPLVGKVLDATGMDDDALEHTVNNLIQQACDRYMKSAPARAGRVGETYDRITDHGRNPIDEEDAIQRAFEQAG